MDMEGHVISQLAGELVEQFEANQARETTVKKKRSEQKVQRRNEQREEREYMLQMFLESHKFGKDVNEPRISKGCFLFRKSKEVIYPLHKATELGDTEMVRLLLSAGADPEQRTSKGRSAEDIAREEDLIGSHQEILLLLQSQIKVLPLREAVKLMEEQRCL
eukprot:symbB.v1.2.008076.t1/scaffold504.1/size194584/12